MAGRKEANVRVLRQYYRHKQFLGKQNDSPADRCVSEKLDNIPIRSI
jgi:hypothetical protein